MKGKDKDIMHYHYGSRPIGKYSYLDFILHLAPNLPKDNQVFMHDNSLAWRGNIEEIPGDLFLNICHWKSARNTHPVKNAYKTVNRQWRSALAHFNGNNFEADNIRLAL